MTTIAKRVDVAHQRRQAFIDIHQKSSLIELKLLYDMYSNGDWALLGFERWQDYCEAPVDSGGLSVSREWATQLVLVYKKYVVELGLPDTKLLDVSPRKLYRIKNLVDADNVDEWIDKVQHLSLHDLDVEAKDKDTVHCKHEHMHDDNAVFYYKCPDCGSFVKVTRGEINEH